MKLGEAIAVTESKITSVVVEDGDMTIASECVLPKYGNVFVTWNLETAHDSDSGTFTGTSHCYMESGDFITARLQGIWRREGSNLKVYSLDLGSNGDRNLVDIEVDLQAGSMSASLYALP